MNPRSTWFWILAATILLGVIFVVRHAPAPPPAGPAKIFEELQPEAVTSVLVRPESELEIRADRTNSGWRLVAPLAYPAQAGKIERLLQSLAELRPATQITVAELRGRPRAKEDFGFSPPQTTLVIRSGEARMDVQIGAMTAPGDQVFIQKVGDENVYVVGAEVLQLIPRSTTEWRDTALVHLAAAAVNRISITNQGKVFVLQRTGPAAPWGLIAPIPARANNQKLQESLENLLRLPVRNFVLDKPQEDLENYGLQPARLAISLWNETNRLAELLFGASLTNHADQVFALNSSYGCLVSVPSEPLAAWSDSVNEYRDPFLVGVTPEPKSIEVNANGTFTLQREAEDKWQVLPGGFAADNLLVKQFLAGLRGMRIVGYVKDVVTPPDLPAFGLAPSRREYTLRTGPATNDILVQVRFGTNQEDRVFAGRSDESSIYTVNGTDVGRLPANDWALRERKIFNLSPDDIARVTMRQGKAVRQFIRNGPHDWSLAPGSQGIINELAVEETVRGICQLSAVAWSGYGEDLRARFGFTDKPRQAVIELKKGDPLVLEFGGEAPSTFPYAGVTLNQQFWVFEISWPLYRDIASYLGFPLEKP